MVKMEANTSIQVGYLYNAGLVANGTASDPVIITSHGPDKWYHIDFTYLATNSSLRHVTIENGGARGTQPFMIRTASDDVTIEQCTIQNSASQGLRIINGAVPTLDTNTFVNNQDHPIHIHGTGGSDAHSISAIDESSTYTGNGDNRIRYSGGNIMADATAVDPGIPYHVTGSVVVRNNKTLTIDPGVEMQFDPGQRMVIGFSGISMGTLMAEGIPDQIIMTEAAKGNPWHCLEFTSYTGAGTILDNVLIEKGASNGGYMVEVNNSDVTIRNCMIQKSRADGLRIQDGLPVLFNNTYQNNGGFPINVNNPLSVTAVDDTSFFPDSIPAGIGDNRVQYIGGAVTGDVTFKDPGIPYRFDSNTTVSNNATMTIEPGVELQMDPDMVLNIGFQATSLGTLMAQGTEANPIVITDGGLGPWGLILFRIHTGSGTILDNVNLRNGGFTNAAGAGARRMLDVFTDNVTIRDCEIIDSAGEGLRISAGRPTLENNTYKGNASFPIGVYDPNSIAAVDTTSSFTLNGDNRIGYSGGNITDNTIIVDPGIPYNWQGSAIVRNGAHLVISPGVEIQFDPMVRLTIGHNAASKGALTAIGSDTHPILFTSGQAVP